MTIIPVDTNAFEIECTEDAECAQIEQMSELEYDGAKYKVKRIVHGFDLAGYHSYFFFVEKTKAY